MCEQGKKAKHMTVTCASGDDCVGCADSLKPFGVAIAVRLPVSALSTAQILSPQLYATVAVNSGVENPVNINETEDLHLQNSVQHNTPTFLSPFVHILPVL